MSLAAALEAEKAASRKGPLCGIAKVQATLDPADLKALDGYLADRDGITSAVIYRALRAEGHTVGKNTIERHRKGECHCGRA